MQGLNTVHVLWESFKCPVVSDLIDDHVGGTSRHVRVTSRHVRATHVALDTLMNIMLSISENTIMNCYLFSYEDVSVFGRVPVVGRRPRASTAASD